MCYAYITFGSNVGDIGSSWFLCPNNNVVIWFCSLRRRPDVHIKTSHFDFCSSVAQTKRDGQLKNTIFCYSTNHETTFCTRYKLLKDKNNHFNFPLFFSLPLSRLPLSMTRILNFFVTTIFYCNHYFHFLSCYFMILICSGHRAFNMI